MGLYYLNSRYYDPETGRFINADSVETAASLGAKLLNGLNLYAYCLNNLIYYKDSLGCWAIYNSSVSNGGFFSETQLELGFYEYNLRAQFNGKITGSESKNFTGSPIKDRLFIGIYGKASVLNFNNRRGYRFNENVAIGERTVIDVLTVQGQAGVFFEDLSHWGLMARAEASLLTARQTVDVVIYGVEIEAGVTLKVLSVGVWAEASFKNGEFKLDFGAGFGLFGIGFVIRIRLPWLRS